MSPQPTRPYHHGDLRPALLRAAVEAIGQAGPAAMSLREVARRAGVSHAAAAYHFGDKTGLLTAVAAQGYRMLTEELQNARDAHRSFLEVGVAYVRFAVSHRAHFEVMYRPELYRPDDPEVRDARAAAAVLLYGTASPDPGQLAAGAAAWSLVRRPVGHLFRIGTVGLLPVPLRERMQLPWSRADELELRSIGATLRLTHPLVPERLRVLGPTYLRLQRRRGRLSPPAAA